MVFNGSELVMSVQFWKMLQCEPFELLNSLLFLTSNIKKEGFIIGTDKIVSNLGNIPMPTMVNDKAR